MQGPYDLKIDRIENCDDEGTKQVHFESKLSNKGTGKYVYSSPFTLGVPIDDNFKVRVQHADYSLTLILTII